MTTKPRPAPSITQAADVPADNCRSVSVSFHSDAMVQVCIWHDLHLLASVVMTPIQASQLADAIEAASRGRITRTPKPRTETPSHV